MALRNLLLALCFSCAFAFAGEEIFSVEDPRGDDFGSGNISYPSSADYERGDLDLLEFSAERTKKGTWFSARFANKVRSPETRTSKLGNVPLDEIARHGFFNLNVDVYIDTDGYEGSGRTDTLPGRQIRIADTTAWDKAVILTPRPHMAAKWMSKNLGKQHGDDAAARTLGKEEAEKYYHFADRIRVSGKTIRFFVPNDFLGGPAKADWRYTVIVTGADPEMKTDIKFFKQKKSGLFMMPVGSGRPFESFQLDYDANPNQPPIIDVLLPTEEIQRQLLSVINKEDNNRSILGGLRADGLGGASPVPAPRRTTAALPKSAPRPVKVTPGDQGRTIKPAEPAEPAKPVRQPKADSHAGHSHAGHSHGANDQHGHGNTDDHHGHAHPPKATKPRVVRKPEAAPAPPSRSIADRLRELENLREQGLVTEEEYKKLRAKILSQL